MLQGYSHELREINRDKLDDITFEESLMNVTGPGFAAFVVSVAKLLGNMICERGCRLAFESRTEGDGRVVLSCGSKGVAGRRRRDSQRGGTRAQVGEGKRRAHHDKLNREENGCH